LKPRNVAAQRQTTMALLISAAHVLKVFIDCRCDGGLYTNKLDTSAALALQFTHNIAGCCCSPNPVEPTKGGYDFITGQQRYYTDVVMMDRRTSRMAIVHCICNYLALHLGERQTWQ
jgi:hypothetical protein